MNHQKGFSQPRDRDDGPYVLLIDDEEVHSACMELVFKGAASVLSAQLLYANSISAALDILSEKRIQVILLDKDLGPKKNGSSQNGIEAIPELLQLQPHLQILMFTGSNDVQDVVQAMNYGAFGYVTKDAPHEILTAQIQRALAVAEMAVAKLHSERTKATGDDLELGGKSKVTRQLMARAQALAESDRPILLTGESGTGKTTIARIIHKSRKDYLGQEDRLFCSLNMAAISPNLIESELFGTEPGAYTGASSQVKQGFFEAAHQGTLFLDEIGEASLDLQAKLLKAIDEHKFYRVGGRREIHSSFKLICATNRNLEEMVKTGEFREDLYLRISTLTLDVPSLEDRKEDIPDIVRSLLPRCCRDNRVQTTFEELPQDFIDYLTHTKFRGNIRGIEQQVARLLVLAPKDKKGRPIFKNWRSIREFKNTQTPTKRSGSAVSMGEILGGSIEIQWESFPGLDTALDEIEKKIIVAAKTQFSNNRNMARALKVSEAKMSTKRRKVEALEKPALGERNPPLKQTIPENEVLQ